jgi:acyl-CoA synthetase (AMP-forming)/AMP-acid ligase II
VVTAIPDPDTTIDLPTAFIVLKPEQDKDRISALASIEAWAERKLAGLQRLAGGIIFLPRFPLVGFKVNRRALKSMIEPGVINAGTLRYIEVAD